MTENDWLAGAFSQIEEAGFSIVPIERRRPPAFYVSTPEKKRIAIITESGDRRTGFFDVTVHDARGKALLASRGRVPCDERSSKDLNATICLFRARAVLDGHFPIELFPTDYGLQTWLSSLERLEMRGTPSVSSEIAEILSEARVFAKGEFSREGVLALHCRAALVEAPGPDRPWSETSFREITDASGDFMVARMALIWKRRSWAASFRERVPEYRPEERRLLEDVLSSSDDVPAMAYR